MKTFNEWLRIREFEEKDPDWWKGDENPPDGPNHSELSKIVGGTSNPPIDKWGNTTPEFLSKAFGMGKDCGKLYSATSDENFKEVLKNTAKYITEKGFANIQILDRKSVV